MALQTWFVQPVAGLLIYIVLIIAVAWLIRQFEPRLKVDQSTIDDWEQPDPADSQGHLRSASDSEIELAAAQEWQIPVAQPVDDLAIVDPSVDAPPEAPSMEEPSEWDPDWQNPLYNSPTVQTRLSYENLNLGGYPLVGPFLAFKIAVATVIASVICLVTLSFFLSVLLMVSGFSYSVPRASYWIVGLLVVISASAMIRWLFLRCSVGSALLAVTAENSLMLALYWLTLPVPPSQ